MRIFGIELGSKKRNREVKETAVATTSAPESPKPTGVLELECFPNDRRWETLSFASDLAKTEVLNQQTGITRRTLVNVSDEEFFEALTLFNDPDDDAPTKPKMSFMSITYTRGRHRFTMRDSGVAYYEIPA